MSAEERKNEDRDAYADAVATHEKLLGRLLAAPTTAVRGTTSTVTVTTAAGSVTETVTVTVQMGGAT